jgi:hypothetical protein
MEIIFSRVRRSKPSAKFLAELTVYQFLIKYIGWERIKERKGGVRGAPNFDCGR